MLFRSMLSLVATMAVIAGPVAAQQSFDESKYPAFESQWIRVGPIERYDQTNRPAADNKRRSRRSIRRFSRPMSPTWPKGAFGDDPVYACIPEGMPRAMNLVLPMEFVIKRDITYIHMEDLGMIRRIYTDGRNFPKDEPASWMGYSIGKWIDEDGDGRYDVLEVETRNLKNPRTYDASGLPMHKDAQTIVKERFYLDKTNPDTLYNQITTYDHALTRPWTVTKTMRRERKPIWVESVCNENNLEVNIGNEHYMLNEAGELMPAKKDQPPPDLKHFNQPKK
jgi:hypothetical protein